MINNIFIKRIRNNYYGERWKLINLFPKKGVTRNFTNTSINEGEEITNRREKNVSAIMCSRDLGDLLRKGIIPGKRSHYGRILGKPEYHMIFLKGEHLLTLDRDKFLTLSQFQMEIDALVREHIPKEHIKICGLAEYNYMRNLMGIPPATEEEKVHFCGYSPIRRILKTSFVGNLYIAKRELPPNFNSRVYEECARYNSPYLLLSVFNYYIGMGDSNSRLLGDEGEEYTWISLMGEARKEYLTWELGEILLYREQAIFLAEELIPYYRGENGEKIYEGRDYMYTCAGEWLRKLVLGLKKYAERLPKDPRGNRGIFYPSSTNKSPIEKVASKILWILALSPFAISVYPLILEFLILSLSNKYGYYVIHYGIILLTIKLLIRISKINKKSEIFPFILEIYYNFKENKIKFLLTFIGSLIHPYIIRGGIIIRAIWATGGLIVKNGGKVGENSVLEVRNRLHLMMNGVITYRGLITNKDIQKNIDPNIKGERKRIIGASLHNLRKKTPKFFFNFWNYWMPHQFNSVDFYDTKNKNQNFLQFRKNETSAILSQIENPEIRIWLEYFIMGDADQIGAPSMEVFPTLYYGENQNFHPNFLLRPTLPASGDFIIHNPKFGWIHYDIKNYEIFFRPNENLALDEIEDMVEKLGGKGNSCKLLIDGSHQPIEKVQKLRIFLSKNSNSEIRDIPIVHPKESIFEREMDEHLNTPANIEKIKILEEKARYLTDHAINSGEDLSQLTINNEQGFQNSNSLADTKLGSLEEKTTLNISDLD